MKPAVAILVNFGFTFAAVFGETPKSLEVRAQDVVARMGGWMESRRPERIAQMTEADRQTMIEYYRADLASLRQPGDPKVKTRIGIDTFREYLLDLGDPEMLAAKVRVVVEADVESPQFEAAYHRLCVANQPEVIRMLIPLIFKDEPIVEWTGSDVGPPAPKSYRVARALLEMMATHPAFNDGVRNWAYDNTYMITKEALPMLRAWWKANENAFIWKNYRGVRPGEYLLPVDPSAKAEVDARREAYKAQLIAKGRDPFAPANWEEWGEQILPALVKTLGPGNPARLAAKTGATQVAATDKASPWSSKLLITGTAILIVVAATALRLWKQGSSTRRNG